MGTSMMRFPAIALGGLFQTPLYHLHSWRSRSSFLTRLYQLHPGLRASSSMLPPPFLPALATFFNTLFAQSAGGDYRQRIEPQKILDALASPIVGQVLGTLRQRR